MLEIEVYDVSRRPEMIFFAGGRPDIKPGRKYREEDETVEGQSGVV